MKSPTSIGKCNFASSIEAMELDGKVEGEERRNWIQVLVAVCWDFGREMNGFKYGSENVAIVEASR